jgi:phosphatidate cytidylyltransferase
VALSDNGAFAVGKLLGRHHLSPKLSPNKTWEGVAGNVLGAYLGTALMGFALPPEHHGFLLLLLPPIIAVGSLWGDLFESAIKREAGVKDAGTWLPGFGGLLDRIDSMILVAPLSYYFLRLTL